MTRITNMKKFTLSALTLFLLVFPLFVSAQTEGTPPTDTVGTPPTTVAAPSYKISIPSPLKICQGANPGSECSIPGLLKVIIKDIIIPIGGIVAALYIMYAGFLYVTARGDVVQIKQAHDALLWGSIGAAVLLGAYVIASAIGGTIDQIRGLQ
jgi:hypothetical protein